MPDQPTATQQTPAEFVRVPALQLLDLQVDKGTMYCSPQPISNGSEDRQGERVNPDGIITVVHESNPVVYYNHSHAYAPLIPPIGTATTPDQKYNVFRKGDVWYSGCLFSQQLKFAYQIFHLVCEGVIRGRSIGGLNHKLSHYKPELMPVVYVQGQIRPMRPGSIQYDAIEMYEWSWTPLPQNRDMVTTMKSILSHDRIDGQKLDPMLKSVLLNLDLAEPLQVPGFSLPSQTTKSVPVGDPEMLNNIVGVTFAKDISPGQAREFLRESPLFHETDLEFDAQSGLLKSMQVRWTGKTKAEPLADTPGVSVLRALKCDMPEVMQAEMPEGAEAMQKPQAPPAANPGPEDIAASMEVPEEVLVDDVQPPAPVGKPSVRYLNTFVTHLGQLAGMAQAALSEIENPKTLADASEAIEILQELQARLATTHDELAADDEAVKALMPELEKSMKKAEGEDSGEGADPESDDESGDTGETVEKSVRKVDIRLTTDLFYGRRHRIPRSLFGHVSKAIGFLQKGGDPTSAARALTTMCKGILPEPEPEKKKPQQDPVEDLPAELDGLFGRFDKQDLKKRARGIV